MKNTVSLCFLITGVFGVAQNKTITEQAAREFFATANDTAVNNFSLLENEGDAFILCADKMAGDIVINGNDIYLVRAVAMVNIYNCSIISLNKEKLGEEKYRKLQHTIPSEYNFGIPFRKIAEKYGTSETASDNINLYYESLEQGVLKDGLIEKAPGKMFLAEMSENISYLVSVNSPPIYQKALFLSQPATGVTF